MRLRERVKGKARRVPCTRQTRSSEPRAFAVSTAEATDPSCQMHGADSASAEVMAGWSE